MILLVNDDGIDAPGLRALYRALRRRLGLPVLAIAPARERSGHAQSITLDRGLALSPRHEPGFFGFAIDGTPADCTKVGLSALCAQAPALVVSGINDGPNVGRSIPYSGTVGAAMEAAMAGCSAMAVSRMRGEGGFDDAAELAARVAEAHLAAGAAPGMVLNLNLPDGPASSWREACAALQGDGGFAERHVPERDAKGRVLWRLRGEWTAQPNAGGSDAHRLSARHPVLTLLRPDANAGDQAPLRGLLAGLA